MSSKTFLFDIGHPCFVHVFKNLIINLKNKGNNVIVTAKKEDSVIELLDLYNISYILLGSKYKLIYKKVFKQLIYNIRLTRIIKRYNVDYAIGNTNTVAHSCFFLKTKSYVFCDDDKDVIPLFASTTYPFANNIINLSCMPEDHGSKGIKVNSYKELAYLHPKIFKPDYSIFNDLNLSRNQKYFIVRFVGLNAYHDINAKGIKNKIRLIHELEKYGKVFISSELELPTKLNEYALNIDKTKIHSVLYFAHLFVGDSQTMTAESAVLGTPSLRCNSFVGKLSYLNELENKYRLTRSFHPSQENKMIQYAIEIAKSSDIKKKFDNKKRLMLTDKVELTSWLFNTLNNK